MNLSLHLSKRRALLEAAREVRELTGKSVPAQLREIVSLRFGQGKLKASEYYAYEVYDDAKYPPPVKRDVVSWWGRELAKRLNDPHWEAVCDDKLICYGLLKGLGLPFPKVYAVYHPEKRPFGSVPSLATPEVMADFLRDGMRYPFFGKPVDASFGKGASSVRRYDRERDRLHLVGGEEIGVEEYVGQFVVRGRSGYLFQEVITQHPFIERVSGGRVGSLRMVVLNHDEGPRLFRALWKVPVGSSITDNFHHGVSGNLLGSINPRTGTVERIVQGSGSSGSELYGRGRVASEVHTHPDTGERVSGITLPDWQAAVTLCLDAAATLPGLRYQSWDVVLSPDGPLFLEVNARGSILQVPGCRGFYDAELRAFVSKYSKGDTKPR